MERRRFFKNLVLGAAAITVAPQVLIPKEEVTVIGVKEMLSMRNDLMRDIVNMPISPYGSFDDYELQMIKQMKESMEKAVLFGECREYSSKHYADGLYGILRHKVQG